MLIRRHLCTTSSSGPKLVIRIHLCSGSKCRCSGSWATARLVRFFNIPRSCHRAHSLQRFTIAILQRRWGTLKPDSRFEYLVNDKVQLGMVLLQQFPPPYVIVHAISRRARVRVVDRVERLDSLGPHLLVICCSVRVGPQIILAHLVHHLDALVEIKVAHIAVAKVHVPRCRQLAPAPLQRVGELVDANVLVAIPITLQTQQILLRAARDGHPPRRTDAAEGVPIGGLVQRQAGVGRDGRQRLPAPDYRDMDGLLAQNVQ